MRAEDAQRLAALARAAAGPEPQAPPASPPVPRRLARLALEVVLATVIAAALLRWTHDRGSRHSFVQFVPGLAVWFAGLARAALALNDEADELPRDLARASLVCLPVALAATPLGLLAELVAPGLSQAGLLPAVGVRHFGVAFVVTVVAIVFGVALAHRRRRRPDPIDVVVRPRARDGEA